VSRLDGLARDAVRRHGIPGVAIAVIDAGVVVACAAAGFADPASGAPMSADGACNWFSMRKIATVTAAMVVAERSDPALAGVPRVTAHHYLPRALAPAGRGTAHARDPRHPQGEVPGPRGIRP
jgi:Beta-lactamase